MKKRMTRRGLLIALAVVVCMAIGGVAQAFAATPEDVNNAVDQILALPSPEEVEMKDNGDVSDLLLQVAILIQNDEYNPTEKYSEEDLLAASQKLVDDTEAITAIRENLEAYKIQGIKVTAGKKKATISWKKPTVERVGLAYTYEVYRDGKKIGTTKSTKFTAKKLKKGKTYKFKVRAYVTEVSYGENMKRYTKFSAQKKSPKIK